MTHTHTHTHTHIRVRNVPCYELRQVLTQVAFHRRLTPFGYTVEPGAGTCDTEQRTAVDTIKILVSASVRVIDDKSSFNPCHSTHLSRVSDANNLLAALPRRLPMSGVVMNHVFTGQKILDHSSDPSLRLLVCYRPRLGHIGSNMVNNMETERQ